MSTIKTREQLKKIFSRGSKPSESDFSNLFDSYFHMDEKIDVSSFDGIYSKPETERALLSIMNGEEEASQFFTDITSTRTLVSNAWSHADEASVVAATANEQATTAYDKAGEAMSLADYIASAGTPGRIILSSNSGRASDYNTVPALCENGKLHPNVLPFMPDISVRFESSKVYIRLFFPDNYNYKQYGQDRRGVYV